MPRRKVNVEEEILKVVGDGATWSEIWKKARISKGALSVHLSKLLDLGLIKRVVDITKKPPAVYYKKTHPRKCSELEIFPNIALKVKTPILNKKFETLFKVSPRGKEYCDIILYLDEGKRNKIDAISKLLRQEKEYPEVSLRRLATYFVDFLKGIMIDVSGCRYNWQGWEVEPLQMQMLIQQEKASLDFEATLVMHFNGKEVVLNIDWDELLQKVQEADRQAQESWEHFINAIKQDIKARLNWIIDKTIEQARCIEGLTPNRAPDLTRLFAHHFPSKREDIVKDPWKIMDTPQKAKEVFIDELLNHVISMFTNISTEDGELELETDPKMLHEQVEKAVDELIAEGALEFVPVYLPKLNKEKAKKKQWEAKEGYPSPTAYLASSLADEEGWEVENEGP
jgi:DNA-binding transcriptional ArsR family regulator